MTYTRLRSILLIALVIFLAPAVSALAGDVTVILAGGTEKIDAFKRNEITYISLSELADLTSGEIDWRLIGHTAMLIYGDSRFELLIGSPYFRHADSTFNITYPFEFRDGKIFAPAETFLSFLDRVRSEKITWHDDDQTIRINSEYYNVTDMSIAPKANGLLVEIYLTKTVAYEVFVTEGNWINVSIRDARINRSQILARKNPRYLYNLKVHQAAGSGQISFRLKKNAENYHHKIVDNPPRIQISVADVDFEIDEQDTTPLVGPDNKIDVVVIDAGHGGSDYGAIGRGGTREKDVALDIAKELSSLIRKDKQFKVIMTRDRDKTVTLQERADIANSAKADLFISIHANSSVKRNVRGWNVFFLAQAKNDSARSVAQLENSVFLRENAEQHGENGGVLDDPVLSIINEMIMTEFQVESHDFAMMCEREMRRNLKIPSRGIDQAGFFVLNMVFTPSVLIESGFISNKTEEKLLKSKDFQKDLAKAIYNALKRFKSKYEG